VAAVVAVIGPGDGATDDQLATAHEVGRLLADAGCVLVNGGLGGVMAAAAAGAASAGGTSVGLLPGATSDGAAPDLTVAIPTGLGELRNALVVRAANAAIAIGGSWGTLSELALAMRTGKPVVAVHGWTVLDTHGAEVAVPRAGTAREAVDLVLAQLPPR
jgi:uncharacterized protein (TIGR00725 family)